jgi:hypothetical protein
MESLENQLDDRTVEEKRELFMRWYKLGDICIEDPNARTDIDENAQRLFIEIIRSNSGHR